MNLTLRQLRAFAALAAGGTFTRAAHALHLSQPALTVQIRSLEEQLGVRLFDRNTRQVALTPIGRELLPTFERLLRDLDSAAENARELAAGIRGVVHVAALPSVSSTLMPAAIARLRGTHPGIQVRPRDLLAQRVLASVRFEESDYGIGVFERIDAGMEFEKLLSDRLEAVFATGHPLAAKRRVELGDLVKFPLIMMDSQSSVRVLVESEMMARRLRPQPTYEVTYISTAAGLARAGLGVTLLPSSAIELEALAGLDRRPVRTPGFNRAIGIVMKSARTLSPAARIFRDALRKEARQR